MCDYAFCSLSKWKFKFNYNSTLFATPPHPIPLPFPSPNKTQTQTWTQTRTHEQRRQHQRQQHQRQQHLESCKSDTSKRLKWHVVVRIFRLYGYIASHPALDPATDCLTADTFRAALESGESYRVWGGLRRGHYRVECEYLLGSMHRLINYKPLLWMELLWLHSQKNGWGAFALLNPCGRGPRNQIPRSRNYARS